jgi:hypothetical protein
MPHNHLLLFHIRHAPDPDYRTHARTPNSLYHRLEKHLNRRELNWQEYNQ